MVERAQANAGSGHWARVAVAVGIGCMLNPLNGTLIASALTEIARDFGISFAASSALLPLYLSCTAALQPLAGAVGDRIGRKRAFLAGIVAFSAVSIAAGFSGSFLYLSVCRCLQASFTALVVPNGVALIRTAVAEESHGRALGVMGALLGTSAALGFPLGSFLEPVIGWRGLFWVSLPLGALALVVGTRILPSGGDRSEAISPLAFIGLPALPWVASTQLSQLGYGDVAVYGSATLGAALLAAVLIGSARSASARRDVRRILSRGYVMGCALILMQAAVLYTGFLVLPTWLAELLGKSRQTVGLYLGCMILTMVIVGPAAGRGADKHGTRPYALTGFALMVAALGLLSTGDSPAILLTGLALLGAGVGSLGAPLSRLAMDDVHMDVTAMAMGLFQSFRFFGGILGSLMVALSLGDDVVVAPEEGRALLRQAMAIAAVALVLSTMLPARRSAPH